MEIRYCLIVSQYYHSYHSFIVKVPNNISNFKTALLKLCEKLEIHKREADDTREIRYGDLKYLLDDTKELFHTYNVNDEGDIYIRCFPSVNRLKEEAEYFYLKAYKSSRGYQRKNIISEISEHHYYDDIKRIVESIFEIA